MIYNHLYAKELKNNKMQLAKKRFINLPLLSTTFQLKSKPLKQLTFNTTSLNQYSQYKSIKTNPSRQPIRLINCPNFTKTSLNKTHNTTDFPTQQTTSCFMTSSFTKQDFPFSSSRNYKTSSRNPLLSNSFQGTRMNFNKKKSYRIELSTNSFYSNSLLTQQNVNKLEEIDQSVQQTYDNIVNKMNKTYFISRTLNNRYEKILDDEEYRRNKEIVDLKPEINAPLFIEGQKNAKTDFSKIIENLLRLKKRITPKLIKEMAKKNEKEHAAEVRKMNMLKQKERHKVVVKLLDYRLLTKLQLHKKTS